MSLTETIPAKQETAAGEIVFQALKARRSVGRVKPDPLPRELVERLLEAAVCAPNHYCTEPWRFLVLTGQARDALGEVMADSLRARLQEARSGDLSALLDKERAKPLRAPVVIAVAAVPSQEPYVVEVEEIAAVAAAVENLLLAAQALGLGAKWRTGAAALDPAVKRFLGLPERAHILAFVYLGYPDMAERAERELSADRRTTWLGWGEDERRD